MKSSKQSLISARLRGKKESPQGLTAGKMSPSQVMSAGSYAEPETPSASASFAEPKTPGPAGLKKPEINSISILEAAKTKSAPNSTRLQGEVELGPTDSSYAPIKKYLKKKGQ